MEGNGERQVELSRYDYRVICASGIIFAQVRESKAVCRAFLYYSSFAICLVHDNKIIHFQKQAMKKQLLHNFLGAALCVFGTLQTPLAIAQVNEKPFVIPEVQTWKGGEGHLSLSGRIVAKSKSLKETAQVLRADASTLLGRDFIVVGSSSVREGDIQLRLVKDETLEAEGYRLKVDDHVVIEAATERGLLWGTRTLLQIAEQSEENLELPCGIIEDKPEYALRGFMIDCGRKFFPMDYLRKLVKVMSYYKMNTLQVHLNDNGFKQYFANDWNKTQAAFRLECDTYPGLTAKDGAYSKKDFIALQELADSFGVEIIPEIDVPAHSLAFSHYRPSLGSMDYGMDHLDLFNAEVYPFFDALFKEYIAGKDPVFRGKRVHIGTDEYSNAKQEVVAKFREFTDHYIRYVESYGKQAVVWGALTHAQGTTPVKADGVLMNCWYNGYADPQEMKRLGYQLVSIPDGLVYLVPAAGYYYDYLNCHYLYDNWTPATIGNQKFEENDPSIEGGMFAVWNDHVGNGITVKDVHHRVFPAMQTVSVKCWGGVRPRLEWIRFDSLRNTLSEAPGVNELARIGQPGETVVSLSDLKPNQRTDYLEVGYDYSISFDLEAQDEKKGTVLLSSPNAAFYLSDPREGKLGFMREGYLNTFNYRVEPGKKVKITIEGDNRRTRLFVDGQLRDDLSPKPLYVFTENDLAHYQTDSAQVSPVVYAPSAQMFYQRTLVFPLEQAGNFKSMIKNFQVMVKK